MIRSMYSAVSGMRSHQVMMDIVGNNIANVNTQGYKRNQAIFQDVISQIVSGASAPTADQGGQNPSQVGLGVMMTGTAQQFGQGFLQVTNRDLDIAIQGDGFFVVDQAGDQLFTRAGAFFLDADGRMVTGSGGLVQGWAADETGAVDASPEPGIIRLPVGDQSSPVITSEVKLGGNMSSQSPIGTQLFTGLEVFDSLGNAVEVNVTMEKTAADTWAASGTYGAADTPFTLTDNVISFVNGEVSAPADLSINIAAGQIPGVGDVSLVIGGDSERRITQFGSTDSLAVVNQNGAASGVLQSMRVGPDGTIVGSYSNGLTQSIAQIAIANFSNSQGLERVSGSNWRASPNSGQAQLGVSATGGRGTIAPGTIEMSNVDLGQEFTELIRSQRGFQANSRVVTSSDELLQEIVNLKR